MSIKCACGNETNEKDGVCRVCKLFGTTLRQAQGDNCHGEPVEPKGGVKMAAPKDRQCTKEGCESYGVKDGLCREHFNEVHGHKKIRSKPKCEVEGCEKQQWKDHRCMRHYNEKHGIERKKRGRKKQIATPRQEIGARNDKKEKTTSTKSSNDNHKSVIANEVKQSQFIDVIKDSLRNEVGPVIENIKKELTKLEGMIA